MNKTMMCDLTEGSITKNLIRYAWPLFIANALQAIYNVVDMVVVGQVDGGTSMAAVSIGGDILHVVVCFLIGFTSAGQILISQFVGAGNRKKISQMIGTMYTVTMIMAVVIGTVCYYCLDYFLDWLNTPVEAYEQARVYLLTCAVGGIIPMTGYNTTCGILRGMGNSKQPCIFIAVASVLNIVLDIWFVAGLKMGPFGAALATVLGQAVSFLAAIVYLYKRKEAFGFDFKLKSFKVDKDVMSQYVKLAVPLSIQTAAINISKIILSAWINLSGVVYTALAGIYNKIGMFLNLASNALTTSGSTIIGQCIGAEKFKKVSRVMLLVLLMAGIVDGAFALIVGFFPVGVFGLFTSDAAVVAQTSILVLPVIINCIGTTGRSHAFSLINGSANHRMNLLVAIFDGIISRIGFAYLFGFIENMGPKGFWLGDSLAGCVPFFIGLAFYLSGKWKKSRVKELG